MEILDREIDLKDLLKHVIYFSLIFAAFYFSFLLGKNTDGGIKIAVVIFLVISISFGLIYIFMFGKKIFSAFTSFVGILMSKDLYVELENRSLKEKKLDTNDLIEYADEIKYVARENLNSNYSLSGFSLYEREGSVKVGVVDYSNSSFLNNVNIVYSLLVVITDRSLNDEGLTSKKLSSGENIYIIRPNYHWKGWSIRLFIALVIAAVIAILSSYPQLDFVRNLLMASIILYFMPCLVMPTVLYDYRSSFEKIDQ